jgi:hypothetical protein
MDEPRQPPKIRAIVAVYASVFLWLLTSGVILLYNQSRMAGEIAELHRAVNRFAKLPANSADAETSVAKGREAIRKGQWELGQLYFVNAVTNAPRHVGHLDAYATAVLERDNIPLNALDRLSSVLQLAAYQVDSGDVPAIISLIERAEQSRKRSLSVDEGMGGQKQGFDSIDQWDRLSRADSEIWKDALKLRAFLKSLEDFISDLDEQDDSPDDLKTKATAELYRWSQIEQAAKQCSYIDACLDRLQKGEDLSSQRAVSIVQAAENALPSLWGINPSALPSELKSKFDGYPERIRVLVKQIGDARSVSVLLRIRATLAADPSRNADWKWQVQCLAIEKQLKEAQGIATNLASTDALLEAQKLVERKSEDLKRCRNNQYYAYQSWVIKWCDNTFKDYMTYKSGLSEKDARHLFKKYVLAEVDQSLLSPEVSRVFNDVLSKLTVEMGAEALVSTEKEMGTTPKKKLEDL